MNFKGKVTGESSSNSDGDAIKVFVRVRPLTQGTGLTTDGDHSLCLTVTSPQTVRLHCKPEPRNFTYDHVADMNTSQEEVFSSVAKNIVHSCINGYNGTIFAYGQTGSGKTFTMLGPSEVDNFSDELRGVIPRSFEYLFFIIHREVERSGGMKSFLCKCSFIEIYNEQIYDLLDSVSTSLFLREDIKRGVFVEGAVEKYAASAAEAYQVLSMGWRNRRVASTSMNRESSRSHAVFTMTLESKETRQEVVNIRTSQLNLVDLAGSERQRDTHAEGSRLKEASSINRSLMCLGQVIMALVDVSNGKNRHICYRDSKLTFLLRDSLGGNAKTYIIANVHPGSRCFGETLSTLQFAQRAKLIKNKAMVNEDTQGNVRQLQAEVRKLKEQLANALSQTHITEITLADQHTGQSDIEVSHKAQFVQAMHFWKKGQEEKKALQEKVSQLQAAWAQKEKFIQSNRMILKFRDDYIAQLKKELQSGQRSEPEEQIRQLQEEIRLLRDQVEHHPRIMRYAAENCGLREEIRYLRSLDSVRSAGEIEVQSLTALEKTFLQLLEAQTTDDTTEAPPTYSTPVTMETLSSISVERMKVQLLQKQSELTATVQAFEEFKEINKKQLAELESEKRYLEKSNKHLEKILEATKAYSKQEVSQLNKIHAETIKILTTPTKGYNLRNRLVPLSSPDHLNGQVGEVDDIQNEQPPPEMNELACEALTEELKQMQEQALRVQGQLDDEEAKNRKLLQQISKLEEQLTTVTEQSSCTEEMFSAERRSLLEGQELFKEQIRMLEQQLEEEKREMDVVRVEVRDLRVVLQSSDKQLEDTRTELQREKAEHERENTQLSKSLISTQLDLDNVRLEWEQVLEKQRVLQDAFDTLQAEFQFELDQHRQQMELKNQECSQHQTQISELQQSLQVEKEQNTSVRSQLTAHKESMSKELVHSVEENALLKKHITDLTNKNQQQCEQIDALQQSVCSANITINSLNQKIEQDKDVVLELMLETRDLRSEVAQKDQTVCSLRGEIADISAKYSTVCSEKEQMKEKILHMENELQELREASERRLASDRVELELIQDDLAYATDEVERLSKVVKEQEALLENSKTLNIERENNVNTLKEQVKKLNEQIHLLKMRESVNQSSNVSSTPKGKIQTPHTPCGFSSSLSQVLECQERELESRRSSMITMEVLLEELNSERTAKNQEIDRLKAQLNEKEIIRMEIQTLLDKFYTVKNQVQKNSHSHEDLQEAIHLSVLRELQEERKNKSSLLMQLTDTQTELQRNGVTLVQSQTCVQELTTELRNRCSELRDLRQKEHQHEKMQQEVEVLRKQVDHLAEENGKLLGHQNPKQKIEYLVKLKKEITKLQEENSKLRQCLHMEESPTAGHVNP
ncbi:kinesin-like protein KIF15-A isoform X2 [Triplophysa rosa]|uniref:Kinesin-like protein KIF15 n=1 Tax=Triplophysa rosa TaxID=992332 RepID=A0A9W7X0T4_TRIRA|nr:kinesin-like protein KIF15-A isoform X2 [Triplophysa rosa]KAI7811668.1 putative kinesin-like protein KIF15 [Triplophysa rosa]